MKAFRTGAVLAGAIAVCFAAGGTASAAGTPYRLSETAPGAWGQIDFGFESKSRVAPIDIMVKDTAADGASARMRIQAMTGEGTKSYAWRTASGNGNVTRETTYLYDSSGVKAVRIQVCRHAGSTDTCSWSPWRYNDII